MQAAVYHAAVLGVQITGVELLLVVIDYDLTGASNIQRCWQCAIVYAVCLEYQGTLQ